MHIVEVGQVTSRAVTCCVMVYSSLISGSFPTPETMLREASLIALFFVCASSSTSWVGKVGGWKR